MNGHALFIAALSGAPPLVERSKWFLLPAVILALAMVFAMMECAATFLARPSRRAHATTRAALEQQLFALNGEGCPYRIAPSPHADLAVIFDPVDPAWRARFAKVDLTTRYRARLVLDEERRQVRWFEIVYARSRFLGFQGMSPRFSWGVWMFAGYIDVQWTGWAYGILPGFPPRIGDAVRFNLDTVALKREIRALARRAGWEFRPKVWPFQVRRRADGTIPRGLLPSSTRYWSERQFWAALYPLLYAITILYITVAAGGWQELGRRATLLPLLGFSGLWWAISGAIILVFHLLNQPRKVRVSSRRPRRSSRSPPAY